MIYTITLDELAKVVPNAIKLRETSINTDRVDLLFGFCKEYERITLHKFIQIVDLGHSDSVPLMVAFEKDELAYNLTLDLLKVNRVISDYRIEGNTLHIQPIVPINSVDIKITLP